jgi:hypothetical protein
MPATNRYGPGAAQRGETTDTVRLSVNLGPAVAARLQDYTSRNGVTATDAIRRAISLLDFADAARGRGAYLNVREKDGTLKEVLFDV